MDAAGIEAFVAAVAALDDAELHSLMVVRHGHVVAERWWEPYAAQTPHLLYSLSKSFTSTALAFAVAEGLVDLDATVLSYFPEFDARVTDARSRAIRVRHVAAMASGHDDETLDRARVAGDGDLVLGLLLLPPEREPGTFFAYNQPCTYALSAIVQRVSGGSLTDFLRPRLFDPLGISGYGWRKDRLGREIGYAGLYAPTEAIAKLGQLYLRNGEWDGRQLLSPEWVEEATRAHVATVRPEPDWDQGYGFQFWRARHGYRGDGAFGQFMVVLPEADAVVAITSQSPDMQGVLDALWSHLLPALTADGTSALSRPVPGGPVGAIAPALLEPGPGNGVTALLSVEVRPGELVLTDKGPAVTVPLGAPEAWTTTGPVASAYAWADGRLLVDVVFVETPHRLRLSLDLTGERFEAQWQTEPLGGPKLAQLRRPD
ncbi:beta-lactamase [Actinoplanes friuliensis DSM 7358]|uniref:Beta-lactamase n=1 Tax=Actinoplanes friuliensis DSM 7358 TaxID=1246995 RepID=U5W7M2_9ACTN|nr:beta-lactamase [Actinoplanes friuliensis DSM 7358]